MNPCPICGGTAKPHGNSQLRCPACGCVWRSPALPTRGETGWNLTWAVTRAADPVARLAAEPKAGRRVLLLPKKLGQDDNFAFTFKSLGIALERAGWRIVRRRWRVWPLLGVVIEKL